MSELAKKYDPKEVEEKWYQKWMEDGRFHGDSKDGGDPFCGQTGPDGSLERRPA